MKNFMVLAFVCGISCPLAAYQAGQANRTNFGQAQTSQQGYRSFSNYNTNRPWSEGVQTEVVETHNVQISLAGSEPADKPAAPAPVAKKQAAATQPAAKPAAPAQASAAPATQQVAPVAQPGQSPAEAAAMMQQVQSMMNMVNNMTGQAGGQAGMPDMSALMGGAAAPKAPNAAPGVKK